SLIQERGNQYCLPAFALHGIGRVMGNSFSLAKTIRTPLVTYGWRHWTDKSLIRYCKLNSTNRTLSFLRTDVGWLTFRMRPAIMSFMWRVSIIPVRKGAYRLPAPPSRGGAATEKNFSISVRTTI